MSLPTDERAALMAQYQQAAHQIVESGIAEMVAKLRLIEVQRKLQALPPEAAPEQPKGEQDVQQTNPSSTDPV